MLRPRVQGAKSNGHIDPYLLWLEGWYLMQLPQQGCASRLQQAAGFARLQGHRTFKTWVCEPGHTSLRCSFLCAIDRPRQSYFEHPKSSLQAVAHINNAVPSTSFINQFNNSGMQLWVALELSQSSIVQLVFGHGNVSSDAGNELLDAASKPHFRSQVAQCYHVEPLAIELLRVPAGSMAGHIIRMA